MSATTCRPPLPSPPGRSPAVRSSPSPDPPAFPVLDRPGVVYLGGDEIYADLEDFVWSKLATRYVLYADNSFELQFSSARFGVSQLPGRVVRTDGSRLAFHFSWGGATPDDAPDAFGTLLGDSLLVEYSLSMQMADFYDGLYVRVPAGTP